MTTDLIITVIIAVAGAVSTIVGTAVCVSLAIGRKEERMAMSIDGLTNKIGEAVEELKVQRALLHSHDVEFAKIKSNVDHIQHKLDGITDGSCPIIGKLHTVTLPKSK